MTAQDWIKYLELQPHPEGGYFKETYKSEESIPKEGLPDRFRGSRSFGTAIYYLLDGANFSAFHQLKADEIWHFYDGSQLVIHQIDVDGAYSQETLGKDMGNGELPQLLVKAGTWFGAEVVNKSSFALVGCTMAPGFEFADFEMPDRDVLLKRFPQHEKVIMRLTRS